MQTSSTMSPSTSSEQRITLYGRNTTLEVLTNPSLEIYRVHLASTNRSSPIIQDIQALCQQRSIPIKSHSKQALSRISKNGRQDQGVAIDIAAPQHQALGDHLDALTEIEVELIVMDNVTNPQNLGMIIRSIAASPLHGLVLPRKGCARLDPLVYKASAGCLLKARILHCDTTDEAVRTLKTAGFTLYGLDGNSPKTFAETEHSTRRAFLLGNESEGLSEIARKAADHLIGIPMNNEVESLNVAVTAGIIAFRHVFKPA